MSSFKIPDDGYTSKVPLSKQQESSQVNNSAANNKITISFKDMDNDKRISSGDFPDNPEFARYLAENGYMGSSWKDLQDKIPELYNAFKTTKNAKNEQSTTTWLERARSYSDVLLNYFKNRDQESVRKNMEAEVSKEISKEVPEGYLRVGYTHSSPSDSTGFADDEPKSKGSTEATGAKGNESDVPQ